MATVNGAAPQYLTMWQGYIPSGAVDTLASYIQTPGSPLYRQSGIPGQLAMEIDPSFPLAGGTPSSSGTSSVTKTSNKRRDIIIGVCVAVGSLLWIALGYWIYRKVKSNHEQHVHRRLSEHMSTYGTNGPTQHSSLMGGMRQSMASSIAPSEVDDRPSSFYANASENEPSMRERRRTQATMGTQGQGQQQPAYPDRVAPPDSAPSAYGSTFFRSSNTHATNGPRPGSRSPPQNPFADIVHGSYPEQGSAGWRRSAQPSAKPVNKRLISGPTLQANSLEWTDSHAM